MNLLFVFNVFHRSRHERLGIRKAIPAWQLGWMLCGLIFSGQALAVEPVISPDDPKSAIANYTARQTFRGQAFFKDNNIWIYNPQFAQTFNMPPADIDASLQGIEAAAFRIEEAPFKLCGMGGQAEQCIPRNSSCVLDVYIDERLHPLPWRNEQMADWLSSYTSLYWLEGKPTDIAPSKRFTADSTFKWLRTLHPFFDSETTKEAMYFYGDTSDRYGNFMLVSGYKRGSIANLTLLTFRQGCLHNSSPEAILYRLETRGDASVTLKRFHEFTLPKFFSRKMNALVEADSRENRQFFQRFIPRN